MINKIGLSVLLSTLIFVGCVSKNESKQESARAVVYQEVVPTTAPQIIKYEPRYESAPQRDNISVTEAYDMLQQQGQEIFLLDVRTQPEIRTDGKIANSQLIPLQVLGQYLNQIDRSKRVLIYCRSGNRSLVALDILKHEGFNATNVMGGINEWKASGLPVE